MLRILSAALLLMAAAIANAASVQVFSPQGEVAQVRQVTVKFAQGVVPFGDLRLPDPFTIQCIGAAATGTGRWTTDRSWVYDFKEPLGPGTRCTAKLKADWKPQDGALTGPTDYAFSTGGPAVVQMRPSGGSDRIDEQQHFLLTLNGPAVESTVSANAWCEVEGIGDRLTLSIVKGTVRDDILKSQKVKPENAARTLVATCARPLPNGAAVRLIWGKGIAAAVNPQVVTSVEQRFRYKVREAFTATFSCERENANAPCMPIRPMRLEFSAPVDRKIASQLTLQGLSGAALKPVFDKDDKAEHVTHLTFPVPLPEKAAFTLNLPAGLKDDAGRTLANAANFPLKTATGDAPPIAKFAAAPFGVIELEGDAMLPITVRHVQGDLRPGASGGLVRIKRVLTDVDIQRWFQQVARFHESTLTAQEAGLPKSQWQTTEEDTDANGRKVNRRVDRTVATREVPLLAKEADAKRMDLPALVGGDPRPFEVIGIPFAQPGYHVVEVESKRLGAALLDKPQPMYVRTGVLVTNLGVHFKQGRENGMVWVTSLDRGKPVEGVDVAVSDCTGKTLWSGRTDANGIARFDRRLTVAEHCNGNNQLFASARKPITSGAFKGQTDVAFVFEHWQKGIEPWRFNLPTADGDDPGVRSHTVFDRTLLRAGETVSMKHFVRRETSTGLSSVATDALPTRIKITHQGSGQEFVQPLTWTAQRHAVSTWNIPPAAKLGAYDVTLERDGTPAGAARATAPTSWAGGSFRVEEFRLPLVDAKLAGPRSVLVTPKEVPVSVQLSYLSGGGMAAPGRASAMLRTRAPSFAGFEDYNFQPPREPRSGDSSDDDATTDGNQRLVVDKAPFTTDRNGAATVALKDLPTLKQPSDLLVEATFNDPNGETQTVATRLDLWPSAVVVGIKAASWASARGKAKFTVAAVDTTGVGIKGQKVEVRGRVTKTISSRKRMVGGFYAYDNRQETQDLGALCSGTTDDRGLLLCDAELTQAGEVDLIAQAADAQGRVSQAASSVWVTKHGELWFEQDNDDRMDLLPEKKRYEPGETAKLQVRMPFREATALVAVEREGIIETKVITLRGDDPTVELKIGRNWGPNVYVSVFALRGRIRDVPWYSFFSWGWKAPVEWARAFWYEGREYQAPTAMVDLSRPSFKLGVAALKVGIADNTLQVAVTPDKVNYTIRQKAMARVKVSFQGKPVAGAEVAFAAVDEGLLALRDNASWDLLGAMIRERAWSVETSTAQNEIIGRRHYGRKAVAAGGGGGRGSTRELFDTLLVWKAQVTLDANGEASIEVPLNDSLTSFRLVAVADAGTQQFGTGSAVIKVTQDLQALPGLPPLVRDGDRFGAMLTLRNTTQREMKVRATLTGTVATNAAAGDIARSTLELPPQDVTLPPDSAREVSWPVDVPAEAFSIAWEAAVEEQAGPKAKDRLKITQIVSASVPVRVLQATLGQLDGTYQLSVAAPADALPETGIKRGGLLVATQPKLTGALPGIRRYFETYPFICLEQKTSKSIGLKDAKLWAGVANTLPTYLDKDGLANYFPPRAEDEPRGSDRLTAYVLSATQEAGFELPAPARDAMLDGLVAFVEGRIQRRFWTPESAKGTEQDVRKLAAIDALARYGRAQPRMLGSVNVAPNLWPTAAVIDWLDILKRVDAIPDRAKRLEEANQILRSRLTYAGTTMKFSNEEGDFWWWLMDSADANANRLILAVLDDPAWRDDLPRMVVGALSRQRGGAWLTTTANLWGSVALDKFSAKFESVKIVGRTTATLGDKPAAVDWAKQPEGAAMRLPWPAAGANLQVTQEGAGKPWLTVQSIAAIPLKAPLSAGYRITRTVTAVEQKDKSRWSRGDTMRVRLEIEAQSDMTWVVVSDPVPGGATILGSGLGRDSQIATTGEKRTGIWATYEERGFEAYRSYFDYLPRGKQVVEYSVRLNNPGRFGLPPTRVEAMYSPETFGEVPNGVVDVAP